MDHKCLTRIFIIYFFINLKLIKPQYKYFKLFNNNLFN